MKRIVTVTTESFGTIVEEIKRRKSMSDQTTGQPPTNPDDPAGSSETAQPTAEQQAQQQGLEPPQVKSPDEEGGSDEAREGGTPTHAKQQTQSDQESEQQ